MELEDVHVRTLGECRIPSPFSARLADKQTTPHFVHEDDRVMLDDTMSVIAAKETATLPVSRQPGLVGKSTSGRPARPWASCPAAGCALA